MKPLNTLSKFEGAAATMWTRSTSVAEKQAAAKVFMKYFVTYLSLLAIVGLGGSILLRRFGPTSPLRLTVAVVCFVAALTIMIVFLRAILRGMFKHRAERNADG